MLNLSGLRIDFLAGTLERGGAERQLFYILQALVEAGARPRVLSLDSGAFWEQPIRELGVAVEWVGESRARVPRLLRIAKSLRHDAPDIIQSQHFFANAYAATVARVRGLIDIGAMRSNGRAEVLDSGSGGWLNLWCPRTLAANSRAALQYALRCGISPGRLYLLPNVVDTSTLTPSPRPAGSEVCFLAVGRLVRAKRHDRFLAALAKIRQLSNRPVRALIVGDGPLRGELERQAAALELGPETLQFTGVVADMAPIYRQGDVCVLTSDHEGTPNVLLEAVMACGLPVVSTRVGGVAEIVRPELNGLLIEPDDAEGLAAALLRLAGEADLRWQLGRQARTYVEDYHSPSRLHKHLCGLYRLALPRLWSCSRPVLDSALSR